jgi:hypothetical protein
VHTLDGVHRAAALCTTGAGGREGVRRPPAARVARAAGIARGAALHHRNAHVTGSEGSAGPRLPSVPESTDHPAVAETDVGDLDTIADELYALPPDAFVPARDDRVAAARQAGDRELARAVARLRRPTRAAWLANLLARHRAEQLDGLVALAQGLAQAQQELDGDALRALSGQRHRAVAAMARDAGRLAARHGEPVNDALLRELQGILDAALADPSIAQEVRAGRLTKSVRYSGFGPSGDGAAGGDDDMAAWTAAAPERRARPRPAPDDDAAAPEADEGDGAADTRARERAEQERAERERAAALRAEREQALADAEADEAAARERQEADEAARDRADERHAAARARVAELVAELDGARTEEQSALDAAREAAAAARASARDTAAAAVRATRARTRLEQLPPPP